MNITNCFFFFGSILGSVVPHPARDSLEKLPIYLDMGKPDKNPLNVPIYISNCIQDVDFVCMDGIYKSF